MTQHENYTALKDFIAQEIPVCQSLLVEEAFRRQLFARTDIVNLYRPFDGRLLHPSVCVRCGRDYTCLDSETGECDACFEENQVPQDIYEWWVVSPWLSKRLQLEGQPVVENDYGVWWGRTTTGQALAGDDVLRDIYDAVRGYQ